jgi:hypothetical protein
MRVIPVGQRARTYLGSPGPSGLPPVRAVLGLRPNPMRDSLRPRPCLADCGQLPCAMPAGRKVAAKAWKKRKLACHSLAGVDQYKA